MHHAIAIGQFNLELQSGNAKFELKSAFFPLWPWNLTDDLEKQQSTSSNQLETLCIISQPLVNSKWSYCPEMPNSGQNRQFFGPCDLEIWHMTLKNNRAPDLNYFKICALCNSHWWIQTGVTVRKLSIQVNIGDFLSCATLKFDTWPWKTLGHLFYATWSFVYHFVEIGEFKLELQSKNAKFG